MYVYSAIISLVHLQLQVIQFTTKVYHTDEHKGGRNSCNWLWLIPLIFFSSLMTRRQLLAIALMYIYIGPRPRYIYRTFGNYTYIYVSTYVWLISIYYSLFHGRFRAIDLSSHASVHVYALLHVLPSLIL